MHNELFTIGPITIYGYGLMIAVGVIAAYLMTERLAKKAGLDPNPVFSLLIVGVVSGIIGAKLLFYITILDEIIRDPSLLLNFSSGLVVYGGVIAGIVCAALYCHIKRLPFLRYLDCASPSIALAQGFGRIGCFLAGCCYGIRTESSFSITFTNSAYAPNNVPLFPSQLVCSAFDFLNFLILYLIFRKNKCPGMIGAFYLMFYGVGRFIIEFFRGDLVRGYIGVLSTSQFISVFVALAGVAAAIMLCRKKEMAAIKE